MNFCMFRINTIGRCVPFYAAYCCVHGDVLDLLEYHFDIKVVVTTLSLLSSGDGLHSCHVYSDFYTTR